jgi:hypothetical protein
MVKRSITFRHITADEFDEHFQLESPGYQMAKEAHAAGEASTALEVLEILCLANQLYANLLTKRMLMELEPFGKAEEYLEKRSSEEIGEFVVGVLGKKRTVQILREVMADVRHEAKIGLGLGVNEKKTAAPVKQRRR